MKIFFQILAFCGYAVASFMFYTFVPFLLEVNHSLSIVPSTEFSIVDVYLLWDIWLIVVK